MKTTPNQRSSSRAGFGIASAMVALFIVTFAITAMASLMANTQKSMSAFKRKNDFEQLKISMRNILQSPSLCPMALQSADYNKVKLDTQSVSKSIPIFLAGPGSPLINLVSPEKRESGLLIKTLAISALSDDGQFLVSGVVYNRYSVNISLEAEQPAGSYGARSFKTEFIALPFYTRGDGEIAYCGMDLAAQRVGTTAAGPSVAPSATSPSHDGDNSDSDDDDHNDGHIDSDGDRQISSETN